MRGHARITQPAPAAARRVGGACPGTCLRRAGALSEAGGGRGRPRRLPRPPPQGRVRGPLIACPRAAGSGGRSGAAGAGLRASGFASAAAVSSPELAVRPVSSPCLRGARPSLWVNEDRIQCISPFGGDAGPVLRTALLRFWEARGANAVATRGQDSFLHQLSEGRASSEVVQPIFCKSKVEIVKVHRFP